MAMTPLAPDSSQLSTKTQHRATSSNATNHLGVDPEVVSEAAADNSHALEEWDIWDPRATKISRKLGTLDVVAVVLNKMVGTGIFTTLGEVLLSTGSKGLSLWLLVVGGIYTALALTVYLELAARFPHNGGELIYLDRTIKPGLMFAIAFASFFVLVTNTTANAIAFAKLVMIASLSDYDDSQPSYAKAIKLIAVVILSVVCLLHYFSGRLGLFLNKILALYKFGLLITVFAAGLWAAHISHSDESPHGLRSEDNQHPTTAVSKLSAFVLVLYSFSGWENANYVAGEIHNSGEDEGAKILRRGAYTAVFVVTVTYFLVALSYYLAFSYSAIVAHLDFGVAQNLGPLAFRPRGVSLDILLALSAIGNLIAVVFTSAKVKQALARQRLLPFWQYWERDNESPKGGLVLHWFFTTVAILATPVNPDGYAFVVGLYTYGQVVVVTVVTIGLFVLLLKREQVFQVWQTRSVILKRKTVAILIFIIVIATNVLFVVMGAFRDYGTQISPTSLPGWLWSTIVGSMFALGFCYWGVIKMLQSPTERSSAEPPTLGQRIGLDIKIFESRDHLWPFENKKSDHWPSHLAKAKAECQQDGTQRRLELTLSGFPKVVVDTCRSASIYIDENWL